MRKFLALGAILGLFLTGCGSVRINENAEVETARVVVSGSAAFYVDGLDAAPLITEMLTYSEAFMRAYQLRAPFKWIPWTEYEDPAQFARLSPTYPRELTRKVKKPTDVNLSPAPKSERTIPVRR